MLREYFVHYLPYDYLAQDVILIAVLSLMIGLIAHIYAALAGNKNVTECWNWLITSPFEKKRVAHLIECQRLAKTYGREGDSPVPIFNDLALSLSLGQFLSIGPSGSGKKHIASLDGWA